MSTPWRQSKQTASTLLLEKLNKWLRVEKDSPTPVGKKKESSTMSGTKRKHADSSLNEESSSKTQKTETENSLSLQHVPFKDIKLGPELGFGRNGSVFKARWNNHNFALKQYDLHKGGYAAFHKELAVYKHLEDAWGRLTPEPKFVSESPSGGIQYLGLELGRDPSGSDYSSKEWSAVLHSLEHDYGVQHYDADRCNGLIITRGGQDRLVAIDFEDCKIE